MIIEGPKLNWTEAGWSLGYVPATRGVIFFHEGKSKFVVDLDEIMGVLAASGAPIAPKPMGRA